MRRTKLMICAASMLVCFCSNSQITKAQICTGSAITTVRGMADTKHLSPSSVTSMSAITLPAMFDTECVDEMVLADTNKGFKVHVLSKMYAKSDVRIRSKRSIDSKIVDVLKFGFWVSK